MIETSRKNPTVSRSKHEDDRRRRSDGQGGANENSEDWMTYFADVARARLPAMAYALCARRLGSIECDGHRFAPSCSFRCGAIVPVTGAACR